MATGCAGSGLLPSSLDELTDGWQRAASSTASDGPKNERTHAYMYTRTHARVAKCTRVLLEFPSKPPPPPRARALPNWRDPPGQTQAVHAALRARLAAMPLVLHERVSHCAKACVGGRQSLSGQLCSLDGRQFSSARNCPRLEHADRAQGRGKAGTTRRTAGPLTQRWAISEPLAKLAWERKWEALNDALHSTPRCSSPHCREPRGPPSTCWRPRARTWAGRTGAAGSPCIWRQEVVTRRSSGRWAGRTARRLMHVASATLRCIWQHSVPHSWVGPPPRGRCGSSGRTPRCATRKARPRWRTPRRRASTRSSSCCTTTPPSCCSLTPQSRKPIV